jgi:glycerol-3-phosphate dehydrogenase
LIGARFDLLVIGAGINGLAIARDAAMRGMSVAVLDKSDIASGTTSWSTRLIHGGLRYLEHREFGLVRESLRERELLLRNAPHLVEPLALVLPVYRGGRRGKTLIRAGMLLYDALSYDKSLPRHRMLGREAVLERAPSLEREGLTGGAMYYDAQVAFAERLAVENALAAEMHGAKIATYTRVDRLVADGSRVEGVEASSLLDGRSFLVRAGAVVNVAGPWVDQVLRGAPRGKIDRRYIGGTKGSHLVVGPFPGAPADAIYYEARQDGRAVFVVPWLGNYLIGSTDLRYDGDLDDVRADDAEIEYLLAETNALLPGARLSSADLLYVYSGVRPLPHQTHGAEGAITRSHVIVDHAPRLTGLWSITGGKLTTHRSLAEEVVDAVQRAVGPVAPCTTADSPLPGGAEPLEPVRNHLRATGRLSAKAIDHLIATYGSRAERVAAIATETPELAVSIDDRSGAIAAEIVFAVREEGAATLGDILLRRTMIGLFDHAGVGPDRAAAEVANRHLGWGAERAEREVAGYRASIARYRPRSLPGAPA